MNLGGAYLGAFERTDVRRVSLLVVLSAAILSPDIQVGYGLPAIRLEQLTLAVLLPALFHLAWKHAQYRRLTLLDAALGALACSVALTLLLAPVLVEGTARSIRDTFELARVAEYWLLYRFGLTLVDDPETATVVSRALAVAAVALAAFAVVQYLHPGDFNYVVSDFWTEENNLLALERRGRVIGTVGNANYYAILNGLILFVCIAALLVMPRASGRMRAGAAAGVGAAAASLVLAQSRTAAGAIAVGMAVAMLLLLVRERNRLNDAVAPSAFVGGIVGAALFMVLVPPRFGGLMERFNPFQLADDPAFTSRLSKWKSAFAGNDSTPAATSTCDAFLGTSLPAAPGHEIASRAYVSAPGEGTARDRQRKADILTLYGALLAERCAAGALPDETTIGAVLVPRYLSELPVDPLSRKPYRLYVNGSDFLVGADLENVGDPDGPIYALGTVPNTLLNPSFELGASRPNNWQAIGPASFETTSERLFGEQAARVTFSPGRDVDGALASIRQVVVSGVVPGVYYTVSAWVRLEEDTPGELRLYTVAIAADGTTYEPFAKTGKVFNADRRWEHIAISFTAPPGAPLAEVRVFLLAPPTIEAPVTALVDGFSLSQGPFSLSFPTVRDVSPTSVAATGATTGFRDSPLLGVGPSTASDTGSLDNEYALFLDRYGILGAVTYLGLWGAAIVVCVRGSTGTALQTRALGYAMATFTLAVLIFNVAAGAYYEFQLMGIYWPLVGAAATLRRGPPAGPS